MTAFIRGGFFVSRIDKSVLYVMCLDPASKVYGARRLIVLDENAPEDEEELVRGVVEAGFGAPPPWATRVIS